MKRLSAILMSLCLGAQLFAAVPLSQEEKMEWWNEAKFGMFVHWGPYCLYGGVYNGFNQARGGNLLLNVGPDPLGNIPEPAQKTLAEVGAWLKVNGETVYGTQRSGLSPAWGEVVRKDDGGVTNYYLCGYECPSDGVLALEGRVPVRKAAMLHCLDLAFYRIKPERAKMSFLYDFWSK